MANRRNLVSKLAVGLALCACVISVRPAAAQSTIFNIPSTDTVAEKKVYFEFDYFMQLPKPEFEQFQTFVPRVVIGLTPMLEAGVNLSATHYADDGGTFKLFQPNVKYKFFSNDDSGLAASAGVIGYMALDHDGDNFGQIYGNVSKKLMSGTRITGGVWTSVSYGDDNTAGVLVGLEQPIAGKLSFVADWFSGKNFWGYFTPGVSVALPHNALLNIGYSIGNDSFGDDADPDYKNRSLFIYYGLILN